MPHKPLDVLKKGLEKFRENTHEKRKSLLDKQSHGQDLTEEEEHWLDHDSNPVDEIQLIERLERAEDYDKELLALSEQENASLQKLRELAGDLKKVAGKKRTRSEYEQSYKEPKKKKKSIPTSDKKQNATLEQRIEIITWVEKTRSSQVAAVKHWLAIYPNIRLNQSSVSEWMKNKDLWRKQWKDARGEGDRKQKRKRQTEHPEVTEMMDRWVIQALGDRLPLTGDVLRNKWIKFADLQGIPKEDQLKLSNGWLEAFKKRHNLKEFRCHGEAGSAPAATVESERKRIQELIRECGYDRRDIFNMDETGLFYGMIPDRVLSDNRHSGLKSNKVRLTYALTTNADGTEKRPAFIIGKALCPRSFKKKSGAQLGFYYRKNKKAWMTTDLYQEWISNWDHELTIRGRKILLLQDNFSGHKPPEGLRSIRVENFEANLTAHVQPMDQGVIRCFKAHYRSRFVQRAVDRYDDGVPPADIYTLNQLQAMRMAEQAWRGVDTTTIRNCWNRAGILPPIDTTGSHSTPPSIPVSSLLSSESDGIKAAEAAVESALDELVDTGALQRSNRMDIDSLLNPAEELVVGATLSDEEIHEAVNDDIAARDQPDSESEEDDDPPEEPLPSTQDVLKAMATIQRYTEGMGGDTARKVESVLASFNREIRVSRIQSAQPRLITNFFSRK